jgi:8-amino-7-oxononanoate synthase
MTTGNHPLYEKVEARVAQFFTAPHAVLTSSGYLTNLAVAQALRGQIDSVLVDEHSHGSLRDSLALLDCRITEFKHRDQIDLQRKLSRKGRVALVTDGLFSFDGSIPPLAEYRKIVGEKTLLWIDDAHAAGVLGTTGQGSLQHAGISRANVIQTVTFSKAFGVYGGAILCEDALRSALLARSSVVSGNTPLPLPLAAAIQTALRLLNASARARLRANVQRFRDILGPQVDPFSPVIAAATADPAALSRALLAVGIFPSFIRYPGGPPQGYFRLALSSEHTAAQVALLAKTLYSERVEILGARA